MILRIAFFLLMALGLIGFGTVAWITMRPPVTNVAAAVAAPTSKKVLTAAKAMRAGSLLKPEDLVGKAIPIAEITPEMTLDVDDAHRRLTGSMIRRAVGAGEAIQVEDLMKPGDHGFLAAVLEPGARAVTIPLDANSGVAGLIWPGDRVDLILTQSSPDPTLPMGRRVGAETVLSNARVIAIDQQLVQGAAPNSNDNHARTVTLEVDPEHAQRLSVAQRLGQISVSVRSANAEAGGKKPETRGLPTWARDVLPSLLIDAVPSSDAKIRVFRGAGEVREFKL